LSPEKRSELRREFGEVLLLMAQSEGLVALPEDPDPALAALRWNCLAETCYAPERRPAWLARQRKQLLQYAPGRADPLPASEPTPDDGYFDGLDLAIRGLDGEALVHLIPFTETHPEHFSSWYARGICHARVGQLADAAAAFTVCIAQRSEFAWPYFNRGLVRYEQRHLAPAEADFSAALEKKPGWTMALINRAVVREARKDWAGADRDVTEALAQTDAPTRLYFLRAQIRRAAGDIAAAERDATDGMKRTPTDAISWAARGEWRINDHPQDALKDFEEALKLNPRSRNALQDKAVVLAEKLNRPKEAVAVMDRLLEMYPSHVEARAGRGVYLARLGDGKRARQDAADTLRDETTPFRLYQVASLYAQLSKHESDGRAKADALRYLTDAFRAGFQDLKLVDEDTDLAPISRDPAFQKIVAHARGLQPTEH
jgi:tetratricopeptide (TPR) repeat protein